MKRWSFGPKKLPELGEGFGEGIRSFKSAMNPEDEERPVDTAITTHNKD
jgi:Sec-independent protein translocase protein TatA